MVYDITLSEIQSNMDHQQDKFFNMEMELDVKMFHCLNLDSYQDLTLLQRAERPITPIWTTGRTSYFYSTDLRQDVPLIQHLSLVGRPISPVRTSGRTSHLSSMDIWLDVPLLQYGPRAGRPTYPAWISSRTSHFSQMDHQHVQNGPLNERLECFKMDLKFQLVPTAINRTTTTSCPISSSNQL